jgi:predicted dehydrogenase
MTVEAVMVGAGGRGRLAYGPYALDHPDEVRFVAVAEPDDARRAEFAEAHGIPRASQFRSWEELVERPPLGVAALNATMDRTHHASTLALLATGYEVLLEKPMATSPRDCVDLVQAARRAGRMLQICHVLRYAPFFRAIHDIVRSGRLGGLVSVDWRENLAYFHFAHSFVRGRWSNSSRSAPMILAKCCHDLDQLVWILGSAPCRVASFGSLRHFKRGRVGHEIPERCTDGCPLADECPYFAPRVYLELGGTWFRDAVSLDPSPDAIMRGLQVGPYGRCVYRCDNDAVDHQVVLLEFPDGQAASLTMQAASHVEGRTIRLDGMRATLLGDESRNELVIHDHRSGASEIVRPQVPEGSGHGGGDFGLMAAFVASLQGSGGGDHMLTGAEDSLESHLLAFAAEEARLSGKVIDMDSYRGLVMGGND